MFYYYLFCLFTCEASQTDFLGFLVRFAEDATDVAEHMTLV